MNSSEENNTKDSKEFFKLIGSVVGALGGVAALFVAFGYITVQSFLSNMKLYGLAYFPLQFYKEASVTFLRDVARFYSDNYLLNLSSIFTLILPLISIFIVILPLLFRRYKKYIKSDRLKKSICGLSLIFVLFTVFITLTLGILTNESLERTVFNTISLPVLFALFLYLVVSFQNFNFKKPLKNLYSLFLIIFIALFLSIPVGYGSFLYDIAVFTASVPECNTDDTAFGVTSAKEYKLLYLMGHTSDREIFFDATTAPITIILIDKKLINSIKVNYSKVQTHTIRRLQDMAKIDFSQEVFESLGIKKDDVKQLNKKETDEWGRIHIEGPDIKEKKND